MTIYKCDNLQMSANVAPTSKVNLYLQMSDNLQMSANNASTRKVNI